MTSSNVTIKYGKTQDSSWYTAAGNPTEIKNQLILFFDLREADDLSPHEVVLIAQGIAQSTSDIAARLGGEPVAENPWPTPPTEEEKAERKAQRAAQKAASANSPSTPSEPEDTRKFGDILSAIDEIGRASWRERADRWVRAGTVEQVH